MVLRDRNHPAIIIWSFCNEVECTEHGDSEGAAFRAATLEADHTRPVTSSLLQRSTMNLLENTNGEHRPPLQQGLLDEQASKTNC